MHKQVTTEQLTITDWIKALASIPEREFHSPMFKTTYFGIPSALHLRKYCFFSKGNYTRNLIFKNALFECMTIAGKLAKPAASTIIATKTAGWRCPSAG